MRKGMAQGLARPAYYDRNPSNKTTGAGSGAVAPHALTARWTYTVPAGKRANIDSLRCLMQRITAAAPVAQADALIQYTPNGSGAITLLSATIVTNGVLDFQQTYITNAGTMLAGDLISGNDSDGSTGGTTNGATWIKAFEFDA